MDRSQTERSFVHANIGDWRDFVGEKFMIELDSVSGR